MASRWLHVYATLAGAIDVLGFYDLPLRLTASRARRIGALLAQFQSLTARPPTDAVGAMVRRRGLGFAMLEAVVAQGQLRQPPQEALREVLRLQPLFALIKQHLDEPMDVSRLARWAHLSPSRLHALFQEHLGTTPMRYVRSLRLDEARRRLAGTTEPVQIVAAATGFVSPFHFSRAFRQAFGLSPSQYREQHRDLRRNGTADATARHDVP